MTWAATDITVTFGSTTALDRVSITIEPGVIHSVIGGDGAGKTTLLKVLAGLDVGQRGTVRMPPPSDIGYVPSTGGIFGDLTVAENVEFVAEVYGIRKWRARANGLLERAAISEFSTRIAAHLSGGQRRKLAGVMALLHHPALLVLDELTTGVDPVSRMELWRLIAGAAAEDAAVVTSTSYLDEAERAESVLLLHEGRPLGAGSPSSIIGQVPGSIIDCAQPTNRPMAWRRGNRWRQWDPDGTPQPGRMSLEDAAIVLELSSEATIK
ncbi:MAG: ATP-binding cassette domain-containing protein [Acidimicrobiales bacterium]